MHTSYDNSFFQEVLLWSITSFVSCFLWSLKSIKNGYKERSLLGILGNIFFKSCSAVTMSVGIILLLPDVVLDYTITHEVKFGLAIFTAIYGQGIVDVILRKKFNLTTSDLMDKDDIEHVKSKMSVEEVARHIEQCPFDKNKNE